MISRSAGESGRFEAEESADTDWGIVVILYLKAAILHRIRAAAQNKGRRILRLGAGLERGAAPLPKVRIHIRIMRRSSALITGMARRRDHEPWRDFRKRLAVCHPVGTRPCRESPLFRAIPIQMPESGRG